jgi:hypothetical protein
VSDINSKEQRAVRDQATIEATEKACREDLGSFHSSLRSHVLSIPAEREDACARYGALTPRVAIILGESLSIVRTRMQRLHRAGALMRDERDARGGCVRWWVPGLLAKLKTEGCK